ncbi:hypothetical protein KORDIASMS9_03965 [Kordia sp. SMS9]|uniref:DUF3667 domain-containing protein n=1 Tax=Kordia sp. SMS9 TaxID=2282170 RepID=UPI000E0CC802|nr:DUF3667 domain-containing protein [Kordia sp. SMS9]AXG71708.1 hypothetical protein KORDIASMS9_03965 [Kordia sp. SMS9]
MSTEKKQCSNCGYQLTQYHNYCPNCGQKVDDKLSMRVLFHNTVMNYFSVDARFFKSFIPLLSRPGYLAKKFVSGKRLMYLHPAQFYLFTSIVFFFIFSISTRDAQQAIEKNIRNTLNKEEEIIKEVVKFSDSVKDLVEVTDKDSVVIDKMKKMLQAETQSETDSTTTDSSSQKKKVSKKKKSDGIQGSFFGFNFDTSKLDSLYKVGAPMSEKLKAVGYDKDTHGWFSKFMARQIIRFKEKRGDGIVKAFMDTIPISMFFLIPIFALLLKLFYRKRGRFAHHMVFSFYYFAFIFLASSIIILSNYIVDIPDWIDVTLILSMLIYLMLSLKHFYEQGYIKTFFKTVFLSLIYLIFIVPFTFVLLWVVSFFLY